MDAALVELAGHDPAVAAVVEAYEASGQPYLI